jgi:peptide/nickel transport system substrate-binding protein
LQSNVLLNIRQIHSMHKTAARAKVPDCPESGQDRLARRRARRIAFGRAARVIPALGLVGVVAAGCRPAATRPPGYVVVGLDAAPLSYDPRIATDANSALVNRLVYEGLVGYSAAGEPVPELAERWETPEPLTYRFVLRPARFHSGERVTAEDVVATYRSLKSPRVQAPRHEALDRVSEIVAEDERTVRFTLREEFVPFLDMLTMGILPARCADVPECGIGSGPFRLVEHDIDRIVLARAATAEPAPLLPGIVFRVSPDAVVRALELARGTIDLAENAVDPEVVDWLRGRGLEVLTTAGSTFQYLGFNLDAPPLGDARVRRAIALAIDRDAIITHLLRGYARAANELLPPEHWAHDDRVPAYPYSPDRSRAILDAAGYRLPGNAGAAGAAPRGRFRLTYKTSTVELRRRIAEVIAASLGEVGIDVEIRTLEWATLYEDIRRGNFQLFSLAWVGVNDPDHYFAMLHSAMRPPRGNNRGGYASPLVDELTVAGRQQSDRHLRRQTYARIAEQVAIDLPYVPLWWTANVIVKTPRLEGFVPTPTGDLRGLARAYWRPGTAS